MDFEDFLCKRNDEIYNAIYNCMLGVVGDEQKVEWDMSIIGPIAEDMVDTLNHNGINVCYPFNTIEDDDDIPCYLSTERCVFCKMDQKGELK